MPTNLDKKSCHLTCWRLGVVFLCFGTWPFFFKKGNIICRSFFFYNLTTGISQVPDCDFDDMFVRAHSEVPSEQRFANLSRVVKAGVLGRLKGKDFTVILWAWSPTCRGGFLSLARNLSSGFGSHHHT